MKRHGRDLFSNADEHFRSIAGLQSSASICAGMMMEPQSATLIPMLLLCKYYKLINM